ncbi:lysosome membrane protein 2-like [Amphiura filiformis]|uniref:lysosome membrane protein 2-like n=1 Tax=Amphiura filiformis TaxID=82378 RepID=UPI003B2265A9
MGTAGLVIGALLGILLVGLGGISFPVIDKIIHDEVIKSVILYKNSTVGYKNWADLPGGMYIEFCFFHLNNSAEVLAGGKPVLIEKGPYSYRYFKPKLNISYDHEDGTVMYSNFPTYIFDPETSNGDPSDIITTLNVPLMSIAEQLKYENPLYQEIVLTLLARIEKEDIFLEITINDLLWGYLDNMLKLVHDFDKTLVPDPHFGFMYNRNHTPGSTYEVYSGEKDAMLIANVKSFNGMDQLQWWTTPEANAINGSDGTYNHPFWSEHREEYLFSSDACRSVIMKFERHTRIKGIPTMKFSIPSFALQSGKTYPPNAGFCIPDSDHCLPDGLLNISQCQGGAPAIMSLPHFLFVDDDVRAKVDGLYPDAEKHNAFINVEPYTGASLEGALRMQFNIWMEKFVDASQMKNLPTLPFPVMWVNQHGTVNSDSADTIKAKLITPIFITNIAKWCLIGLGGAILIIVLSVAVFRKLKRKAPTKSVNGVTTSINSNGQTTEVPSDETRPLLS